jgi:hypothetical protein
MNKYLTLVLAIAMGGLAAGCGDSSGGNGGNGGSGGLVELGGDIVSLPAEIAVDTTLTADKIWLLEETVYVTGGTLTIEPGTLIVGDAAAGLIITTEGKIKAVGTEENPIVFTSSAAEGDRRPQDWGGVVLLGKARINSSQGGAECDGEAGECVAGIEGLPQTEGRGQYGGDDDTHDCGKMKYVRIEFAGYTFGEDNELNSLTVGGCGSQTELSYIQAHRGSDDGLEFFGGTADADHIIITGPGDDGLDWDAGYTGTVQNVIVHHFNPSSEDPRGFEGDNNGGNNNLLPRSAPTINNATLIGSAQTDRGVVNRRGTLAIQRGLIVTGFAKAGIDIRDAAWDLEDGWGANLLIEDSCFFDNSPNVPADVDCGGPDEADCNDANGSDEYFAEDVEVPLMAGMGMDVDPELGDVGPAVTGQGTPDYSAGNSACAGAFAPSGEDWTAGWTAFPAN